ncbi:50S ribosomal protein L10 [Candidatus Woesearchaeota archaeon]|jgi:large subunit ribosomal protein L10|nr:50S ribosomal protein L10 [Candidatus Woesearchaeota archaeon]
MAEKDKKAKKLSETKVKVVSEFSNLLKEYPIVAAINMENLPARQLQQMRATLRKENCVLKMTKRRLIKKAIEKSKDINGLEQLDPYLKGMPALLFTKENPFKLYKMLEKSKSKAPAKGGQTAPNDVVVKTGPTGFAPGPIIGELGQIGIKAGIEDGKVVIKADSVVVKEGEIINAQVAAILSRLGIEPMEIGLAITAVLEDGTIYKKDVLAIDEDEFMAKVMDAASSTFNLAVEVGYLCEDTVEVLLQKAYNDSKALALEANFMADAVVENLLAKAEAQASSLKAEVNQ